MGLVTNLDTMPLFCSGARKPRHRLASDHPRPPEDRSWLSACAIPSVSETDPTDSVSHQGASQFRRGTLRAGGAMRVSPVGLASWRSRSVKARITSAASKARFRLPTVVCERTLAPTIRVMASLAAWVLRPISSAALATVRIGAPGNRRSKRSAAELARTRPRRSRQAPSRTSMRSSKAAASATDRFVAAANSPSQRFRPSWADGRVRRPQIARPGKRLDILLRPCRENQRHRRQDPRNHTATTQDQVNERAPHSAVAIDERMNRLELRVGNGCLGDGR